jgi:hypothetical protein
MKARPLAVCAGILGVLFFAQVPASRGMDTIWSGIVLGTNTPPPREPSPDIVRLHGRLKGVFGYNHYRLIREHTELIDTPVEHWLLPGKLFSLQITSARKIDLGYRIHLKIFQEKKMLAETEANLGLRSPVFIRGPLFGHGQLIFVLSVR